MTCKDCIHASVCRSLDVSFSGESTDLCSAFEAKSDYVRAEDLLKYVIRAKSCILTSSEADCEFYALLSILESQINKFRISS